MGKLNRKRWDGEGWRVLAVAVLCFSATPGAVYAQRAVWSATPVAQSNGSEMTLPLKRPVSRANKLSITIDPRWSQNYGYRPIVVTVKTPKPVNADRAIVFRLYSGWQGHLEVEQEFILPSGGASASTTIAVPQYQQSTPFYWWDVWIDGAKDKDLSLKEQEAYGIMQSGYAASSGKSFLAMAVKSGERTLVTPQGTEFEVLSLAASEFPARWIDYTCLDVITLSLDELKFLSSPTVNPNAAQAIRYWIRAGGQLWVNEVGGEFERLPELSKLVQLREEISPEVKAGKDKWGGGAAEDDSAEIGWRPVRFDGGMPEGQVATFLEHATGTLRTVRDPEVIARMQSDPNFMMTSQRFEQASENSVVTGVRDSSQWFVEQPMGLGKVRAFRELNDVARFAGKSAAAIANAATQTAANTQTTEEMPASMTTALQSVGGWSARHGLMPDDASFNFPNLLVQGVGLAPVTEFRVLITLFVLLIGPVNYYLLKRWRRLHLMVLTVPLAAAVVTVVLFGYAIVADGFGTTIRAHSFTTLDQRNGEAACWTRLSFYSGLTPRGGLEMPADVALYPIIPGWNPNTANASVRTKRLLVWQEDEARLARGWLQSRSPTQYLTVRARKSPHRLELTPVRERMRAKNALGSRIEYVAVVDAANKVWEGEKLASGEMVFLKSVEREDAVGRLRKLVRDNAPRVPDALSGGETDYGYRNQWRMYSSRYGAWGTGHGLDTNLPNVALSELAGLEGNEGLMLPPRSYVAVTETGAEVVFGMKGAKEEDSFHVTVGQW